MALGLRLNLGHRFPDSFTATTTTAATTATVAVAVIAEPEH